MERNDSNYFLLQSESLELDLNYIIGKAYYYYIIFLSLNIIIAL